MGAGARADRGDRQGVATLHRPAQAGLEVLREVVDFDAYVWPLTAPVIAVGAAPFADVPCLPKLPALIKAKYATPVNRCTELQQGTSPSALLDEVVDGDLARSRVWREVMSRYGVRDVASTVFADLFGCWGFLDLWRDQRVNRSPAPTPRSSTVWFRL